MFPVVAFTSMRLSGPDDPRTLRRDVSLVTNVLHTVSASGYFGLSLKPCLQAWLSATIQAQVSMSAEMCEETPLARHGKSQAERTPWLCTKTCPSFDVLVNSSLMLVLCEEPEQVHTNVAVKLATALRWRITECMRFCKVLACNPYMLVKDFHLLLSRTSRLISFQVSSSLWMPISDCCDWISKPDEVFDPSNIERRWTDRVHCIHWSTCEELTWSIAILTTRTFQRSRSTHWG